MNPFILLFLSIVAFTFAQVPGSYCETKHNGTFCVTWSFTGPNNDLNIMGTWKHNGTGWVAVGMNPNATKMVPTLDAVVGWVDPNTGVLTTSCRKLLNYCSLQVVAVPCYQNFSSVTSNTGTTVSWGFSRPLIVNNPTNALSITNNYVAMIWGVGIDTVANANGNLTYHGQNNKGSFVINFYTGTVLTKFPTVTTATTAAQATNQTQAVQTTTTQAVQTTTTQAIQTTTTQAVQTTTTQAVQTTTTQPIPTTQTSANLVTQQRGSSNFLFPIFSLIVVLLTFAL